MYIVSRLLLLLLASFSGQVAAVTEQVLSTLIYTRHGDRVPFILSDRPELTPLGAQQLYTAGSNFRQRYINATPNTTGIRGISPFQLEPDELTILSTTDQWVVASAQAFMQGLYPPLESFGDTNIVGQSLLANGSQVNAPLGGYQYPQIQTASPDDINSIYVSGTTRCPAYLGAMMNYFNSSQYQAINAETVGTYLDLAPMLDGVFPYSDIGYFNAYEINDYLQYGYVYNRTIADNLSIENLTAANILADDWTFAMYGNTSAPGGVGDDDLRAIAGRSLATWIFSQFELTNYTQGQTGKINLVFGGYEPMVSFAALTGLTSPQNAAFFHTPAAGSSFVFELVSYVEDGDTAHYPDPASMFVRFFYQNGTDEGSSLIAYPLFARSPSQTFMNFDEFMEELEGVMIQGDEWCSACGSPDLFCQAFYGKTTATHNRSGLQPAIAGVIGALVTLLVIALAIGALMLFGGFRVRRTEKERRKSVLAGFKGSQKLASDQDLTIPKGGAAATVADSGENAPRGHERTGSWELREQARQKEAQISGMGGRLASNGLPKLSFDDERVDPYGTPVKPHDTV